MIVLDTNVVCELMRPAPAPPVLGWCQQNTAELRVTSVTVAEILYGIERLPDGARRDRFAAAAREIFAAHGDEILPFDPAAAPHYAAIAATRAGVGRPISALDAQIAAICHVHHAAVATRNVKDFEGTRLDVINPWREAT